METALSHVGASERVLRMKERLLSSPFRVDIERARYYTRVWRRAQDASACMKAALALEETLRRIPVWIDEDELLVGARSIHREGEPLGVERGSFNSVFEMALGRSAGDIQTDFAVVGGLSPERARQLLDMDERVRRELRWDIIPYWRERNYHREKISALEEKGLFRGYRPVGPFSLYRIARAWGGSKKALKSFIPGAENGSALKSLRSGAGSLSHAMMALKLLYEALPDLSFLLLDMQGHVVPGFRRVLETGFKGIAGQAAAGLEVLDATDPDATRKGDFLKSVTKVCEAVCEFSLRYAELAEHMASGTGEPRASELLEIAERCRRVPAYPARTFMEAVQSFWMTQVALTVSYGVDNVFSAGRVDQYFNPYYQKDLAEGRITREKALDVIQELMIKGAGFMIFGPNNYTIGGLHPDGSDATNELSCLFLEALEGLRGMGAGLSVRIAPSTPDAFLRRAVQTYKTTAGVALYNDVVVIRDLLEDGYSIEDARYYSIVGCVEPTGTGNNFSYTAGNAIFLVGVLEMALNRGRRIIAGRRVGPETPDPREFRDFEDVKRAFQVQLAWAVDRLVEMAEEKDRLFMEFPSPLLSSTVEGCLESRADITWGGACYNHGHVNAQGLATVADSLAAIRWAVFERGIVSMEELASHLRNNFRGAEALRRELSNSAPKFGNDDPAADEMAEWVTEIFCREVRKHRSFRGGCYRPSLFSSGTQDVEGMFCCATPDGRLAGEPISNGISPVNGSERNGMTAALKSAAGVCAAPVTDGTALNINLSPGLLDTDEKVEKLASAVRGFFELGGRHIQFNPLDARMLRDAQAHPEKYPDLTVKVSGYSARFVDLCASLQNDIIARTEFGAL